MLNLFFICFLSVILLPKFFYCCFSDFLFYLLFFISLFTVFCSTSVFLSVVLLLLVFFSILSFFCCLFFSYPFFTFFQFSFFFLFLLPSSSPELYPFSLSTVVYCTSFLQLFLESTLFNIVFLFANSSLFSHYRNICLLFPLAPSMLSSLLLCEMVFR